MSRIAKSQMGLDREHTKSSHAPELQICTTYVISHKWCSFGVPKHYFEGEEGHLEIYLKTYMYTYYNRYLYMMVDDRPL